MNETQYLTRDEAALACGCHRDTLRRYEKNGKLPHARKRSDGTTEIPVPDLVSAGLLNPLAADAPLVEIVTKTKTERELLETRQDLAICQVRFEEMRTRLHKTEDEVLFLRGLCKNAMVA